jgi:hypothetical protein
MIIFKEENLGHHIILITMIENLLKELMFSDKRYGHSTYLFEKEIEGAGSKLEFIINKYNENKVFETETDQIYSNMGTKKATLGLSPSVTLLLDNNFCHQPPVDEEILFEEEDIDKIIEEIRDSVARLSSLGSTLEMCECNVCNKKHMHFPGKNPSCVCDL